MSNEIEGISVVFGGETSALTDAVSNAGASLDSIASSAADASAAITEGMTGAAESMTALSAASDSAAQVVSAVFSNVNPEGVVTATDVARANLTILESKVQEAREKLQTLQNAANAGEAVTGIPAAEAQLTLLMAKAQDAREALANLGTEAIEAGDEVASGMSHSGGGLSMFGEGLGGMITKVGMGIFSLQALWQTATQGAQALFAPAMSIEETTSSLEVFTGSTAKAKAELQALSDFAAHTPFQTQDIDDAALKMQAVGINAKQVIPYIQALGDSLDATGRLSSADLAMIVDNFTKIKTEGHLTTDVMNSFAIQGVDAWGILEKQTGKSRDQLGDMISKGLYPAKQAMDDLTKGIEKSPLYKGQMANDTANMTGILSTLKSNLDQVLGAFASPILKAVEPLFNNLATTLSSSAFQSFAGNVGQGIVNVFTSIGKALGGINLGSLASNFASLGTSMQKAFAGINLGNAMDLFKTLAQTVGGVLTSAFRTFGPILAQVAKWFVNDLMPALNQALPPIGNLINAVIQFAGAALRPLLNAVEPLVPPILKLAGEIGTVLAPAVQFLTPIISTILTPAFKALFAPMQAILDLLTGNWKGALDAITNGMFSAAGGFDGMKKTAQGFASSVGQFFSNLGTSVHNLLGNIGAFFSSAGASMGNFFSGLGTIVHNGLMAVVNFFVNAFQAIGGWFTWLYNHNYIVQAICDFIRNAFQTVVSWLQNIWATVTGWLSAQWSRLSQMANAAWSAVTVATQAVVNSVIGWLHGIWDGAISNISSVWRSLSGIAQNAWSSVTGVFRNAWGGISSALGGLLGNIKNWFSNLASQALDWGKNIIQSIINGITNMLSALGNAASNAASTIAKYLGFHSPAEEGPGRELDMWPRNMIKSYAAGIIDTIPELQHSLTLAMTPVASTLSQSVLLGSPQGTTFSGASSSETHVHIYLDSNEMTNTIGKKIVKKWLAHGPVKGAA